LQKKPWKDTKKREIDSGELERGLPRKKQGSSMGSEKPNEDGRRSQKPGKRGQGYGPSALREVQETSRGDVGAIIRKQSAMIKQRRRAFTGIPCKTRTGGRYGL